MVISARNSEQLPAIEGFIPNPSLGFGEKMKNWPPYQTCCQKVRRLALPILLGIVCVVLGATLGAAIAVPIAIAASSQAIIGWGLSIGIAIGSLGVAALAVL